MDQSPTDASIGSRFPAFSKKPVLTPRKKSPILAASSRAGGSWLLKTVWRREDKRSTWMGLHRGIPRRRDACGPRSVRPLAWMQAARFGHTSAPDEAARALGAGRDDRGASNRSRKSIVSFAPLGHSLSGGLFLAPRPSACGGAIARPKSRCSAARESAPPAGRRCRPRPL